MKNQGVILTLHRDGTVRTVPLTTEASEAMNEKFSAMFADFFAEAEEIEYNPGYSPSQDEVFVVEFDLPEPLCNIYDSVPSDIEELSERVMRDSPPHALVHVTLSSDPLFLFQSLTKRDFLQAKKALLVGDRYYGLNSEDVIVPPDRIDAVQGGGRLYFRKEMIVRRFLDVHDFVAPATNAIIESYLTNEGFFVSDMSAVLAHFNSLSRRKIARLHHEGKKCSVDTVKKAAEEAGIDLLVSGGSIVVLPDKGYIKALLDLLSDCYLKSTTSPGSIFYANSKRIVS